MSGPPSWPGGARGALNLTFDNLGEAAELELGAIRPDAALGDHFTATRVLPSLLGQLAAHELPATFFVEGINTEIYPDALQQIDDAGHELGYHAWRHEQWGDLGAGEQAENLTRGLTAFEALGLEIRGMRPPGGGLGAGGLDVLHHAGLRYCSPAGEGVSAADGIALLPFRWRHVDASCVLPPLAPVRERMTGSPQPLDPAAFLAFLETELEALVSEGGHAAIVLHLFMLEWLGEERLERLLGSVAATFERGDLWVSSCAEAAAHILADPAAFGAATTLDSTSWT